MRDLADAITQMALEGKDPQIQFVENTLNPNIPEAKQLHPYSFEALGNLKQMEKEWQDHVQFFHENCIGPPKSDALYTQDELIQMGMVGVYLVDDS